MEDLTKVKATNAEFVKKETARETSTSSHSNWQEEKLTEITESLKKLKKYQSLVKIQLQRNSRD